MAKITSKYQVTVPKSIADRYGIRPGDEIEWIPAGDVIRVIPGGKPGPDDRESRLRFFDQATARHRSPEKSTRKKALTDRGWTRQDLYERGRSH